MLIRTHSGEEQDATIANVCSAVERSGGETRVIDGTVVIVAGAAPDENDIRAIRGVSSVEPLATPYKLVARAVRPSGTVVRVGALEIGGVEFVVAAGPCAVEDAAQMHEAADAVARAGARLLRGGAYKPRTSPYAFQGLGEEGLCLLAEAGRAAGLPTVTEVIAAEDVPLVARYADVLQVGARNVQNFALLKALGTAGKPVLLKRGMSTTIDELLMAAEYIVGHGNPNVILCERGIRTFENATRNTLDLNAVAVLKLRTHLPVIVDPSHGTGRRELIAPLAKAAAAVGADGLIVEVHPWPERALSDGAQSLTPDAFASLMREIAGHLAVEGRSLGSAPAPDVASSAISAYRDRIDEIDAALIDLLNRRAHMAAHIGRVKGATGVAVYCPTRERDVLERVSALANGPLGPDAVARLFSAIMTETRAIQTRSVA